MTEKHELSDLERRRNELEDLALTRGLFREEKDRFEEVPHFEEVTDTCLPKYDDTEDQINIDFKARVLVIDDDDQIRELLKTILEREGLEVEVASDGQEGINRFKEMPFDLIISDIMMPAKEGVETIMEIKTAAPDVKFIAISGGGWQVTEIDFDMARKLGALTLTKPVSRSQLLCAIHKLLSER